MTDFAIDRDPVSNHKALVPVKSNYDVHARIKEGQNAASNASRHSKAAITELYTALVIAIELCEQAREGEAEKIARALWLAKPMIPPPEDGIWRIPLVKLMFQGTFDNPRNEAANISKYASALAYAERQGITSKGLADFLKENSIAKLARLEARERAKERVKSGEAAQADATIVYPKTDAEREERLSRRAIAIIEPLLCGTEAVLEPD